MLYGKKEEVKKLGGANEIYLHRNKHYLIVNVFLEKKEAEKTLERIIDEFPDAGVLRLHTNSFSKRAKKKIIGDFEIKNSLKRITSISSNIFDLQIEFLSKDNETNDVTALVSKHKLESATILSSITRAEESVAKIIASHIEINLLYYEEFFEKYYTQIENRAYLLNNLAVKLALNQVKMINNLSVSGKY